MEARMRSNVVEGKTKGKGLCIGLLQWKTTVKAKVYA
jgi:hypothetical protein